jgi:hypothetical protein
VPLKVENKPANEFARQPEQGHLARCALSHAFTTTTPFNGRRRESQVQSTDRRVQTGHCPLETELGPLIAQANAKAAKHLPKDKYLQHHSPSKLMNAHTSVEEQEKCKFEETKEVGHNLGDVHSEIFSLHLQWALFDKKHISVDVGQ